MVATLYVYAVLFLQSVNNQLFSTLLWSYWSSGNPGSSESFAAGCVLLLLILLVAISAMIVIERRLEIGPRQSKT